MKRLYLEYAPDHASLQKVLSLQRLALLANNNATAIETNQVHLTLLHFGITEQVYKELLTVLPALSWADYMRQVNRFADSAQARLPRSIEVATDSLALYGHGRSVLVCELSASPEASQAQRASVARLKDCLRACGLDDPEEYMRTNHNFMHALDFKPHISLARNVQALPTNPIMQEKLHLELVPLSYDLRHEQYT